MIVRSANAVGVSLSVAELLPGVGSVTPAGAATVAVLVSEPLADAEIVQLAPHPVLGKWLYLSQREEEFEQVARAVVEAVKRRDLRVGVEPGVRKKRAKRVIGS